MPVLFAPDGDWTTDHSMRGKTVEEVQEKLCNMGSRWFFYPFHAIIRVSTLIGPTKRLVDVAYPFEHLKGRPIKSMSRYISRLDERTISAILES